MEVVGRLGGPTVFSSLLAHYPRGVLVEQGCSTMQTQKPIIGINGEFRPAREDQTALSWYPSGYYDSVLAAGGIPVLLPPYSQDHDLRQVLEMLDGLILAGSTQDLNTQKLGMLPHPYVRPMPTRREEFDRRLIRLAVEYRLPTLAIGAGMQQLNVLCGGSLYQHVMEEVPRCLPHRDPSEYPNRHLIEIIPGTLCWQIYGPGEIRVNSDHHMAVRDVAPQFRVSAVAPDGVIECIESIDQDWFCLGVQWHPEDSSASRLDTQIFEEFLQACRHHQEPTILPMRQRVAA
ncbi:MAG: gamma-glutamyl-gamma-aminobutyrate hydrolase [Planctomycetaceae bacterium]|nr:MAG: gamma-glutamyl-gamma-aminobutyrate hydrolase [Planctomycetaceae bacterium]